MLPYRIEKQYTNCNQTIKLSLIIGENKNENANKNEIIVGYVEGNRLVWYLEVEAQHQNKGYGTILLQAFQKEFTDRHKNKNKDKITVLAGCTHKQNEPMRRVFEKVGFVLDNEENEKNNDDEDEIYYKLNL